MKAGAIGPHNHPLGYVPSCAQCKAERREIRAKAAAKAQREAKRHTPQARMDRAEARRNQRATRYASVVALPKSTVPTVLGENEAAVIAQCEHLPKAEDSPSTVQQCRTLAKILDNDEMSALWPQTSRQMHALLSSMAGAPKKDAPHAFPDGNSASGFGRSTTSKFAGNYVERPDMLTGLSGQPEQPRYP
jgi:hypothetical protein